MISVRPCHDEGIQTRFGEQNLSNLRHCEGFAGVGSQGCKWCGYDIFSFHNDAFLLLKMNSSYQFHVGALTTALLVVLASVVNVSVEPETAKQPSQILMIAARLLD